jgi:hypothetical protein
MPGTSIEGTGRVRRRRSGQARARLAIRGSSGAEEDKAGYDVSAPAASQPGTLDRPGRCLPRGTGCTELDARLASSNRWSSRRCTERDRSHPVSNGRIR